MLDAKDLQAIADLLQPNFDKIEAELKETIKVELEPIKEDISRLKQDVEKVKDTLDAVKSTVDEIGEWADEMSKASPKKPQYMFEAK